MNVRNESLELTTLINFFQESYYKIDHWSTSPPPASVSRYMYTHEQSMIICFSASDDLPLPRSLRCCYITVDFKTAASH